MIGFSYMLFLLISIIGMIVIDHKYKLAFFNSPKRTFITLLIGVMCFSIWDAAGIETGVFFIGKSEFLSGIILAPEYPIEELIFLFFLCYFTLIMYLILERKCTNTF